MMHSKKFYLLFSSPFSLVNSLLDISVYNVLYIFVSFYMLYCVMFIMLMLCCVFYVLLCFGFFLGFVLFHNVPVEVVAR